MPRQSLERLAPAMEIVDLRSGDVIYRPDLPIETSYFPTRGLVSLVKTMSDGRTVEIGAFGSDGVTGPDVLFGVDNALLECIVRIPGVALSIRSSLLQEEVARSPEVRAIIARFVVSVFHQVAQTAACNRLHSLEQRCCRWLLVASDSVRAESFATTHESLAKQLGVQRPGVSLKLEALEKAGIISCSRGQVTILDRQALAARSCECYDTIRNWLNQFYSRIAF
jgi:CRP-like cAMP-binding protein